jgi:hypothetical protein
MFQKYGNVFTIADTNRVKTASDWSDFIDTAEKSAAVEGITIHKNLDPTNIQKAVCDIDLDNYIYIHTTIMASVNIEPASDYFITRDTEKYINTNGDAWPREQLIKDYNTFKSATVYVEHDQNPERAKGKVLDAIARDMGDTILIDLLFCIDRRHDDLVHNVETGIANAVSMGCTTKYTICSICGNVAHDEKEYCTHVKRQKNQMIKCVDGVYRKACELCYDSNFYDCSVVANPAFAGAVFRKLVAADQVSMQLFSNLLCRKVSTVDFQNEILKMASKENATYMHPSEKASNEINDVSYAPQGYSDIPYTDPHDVKEKFDEQQPKGQKIEDIGKKKKAAVEKCADFGSLVILTKKHDIMPDDRRLAHMFNFVGENTVGRLIGRQADSCAIYFTKIGLVKNIPSDIVQPFSPEKFVKQNFVTNIIEKKASKISDEELMPRRKGVLIPTDEKFQILKVNDDNIEVRWLDGRKSGVKEKIMKKTLTDKVVKWASTNTLASFDSKWNGQFYQLKKASWNEKSASLLDKLESHIDNIQHDITTVAPRTNGYKRYSRSFKVKTKIANNTLCFNSIVKDDNLNIEVKSTTW